MEVSSTSPDRVRLPGPMTWFLFAPESLDAYSRLYTIANTTEYVSRVSVRDLAR